MRTEEMRTTTTVGTIQKTFLDMQGASEVSGFSIRHLRRLIADGTIPTMRVGRKCFILRTELLKWRSALPESRN